MRGTIEPFLPFYLGCRTNIGYLAGISDHQVFIKLANGKIVSHDTGPDFSIKLFLKKLRDLSEAESTTLIEKGFSVGRPKGYSFSPDAFLYLISLHVDLFNLIHSELSIDMSESEVKKKKKSKFTLH